MGPQVDVTTAKPAGEYISAREKKRLKKLEAVVLRNASHYVDNGAALREIRDKRLYRETHPTFEAHCKGVFDLARQRAYQLIEAVDVIDNLKKSAPPPDLTGRGNVKNFRQNGWLPANDAQARELGKIPHHKQAEVWCAVMETAPEGRITAKHIRRIIRNLKVAAVKKAVKEAKDTARGEYDKGRMSKEFKGSLDRFVEAIDNERWTDWRHTDQQVVIDSLEAVITAVKYEA